MSANRLFKELDVGACRRLVFSILEKHELSSPSNIEKIVYAEDKLIGFMTKAVETLDQVFANIPCKWNQATVDGVMGVTAETIDQIIKKQSLISILRHEALKELPQETKDIFLNFIENEANQNRLLKFLKIFLNLYTSPNLPFDRDTFILFTNNLNRLEELTALFKLVTEESWDQESVQTYFDIVMQNLGHLKTMLEAINMLNATSDLNDEAIGEIFDNPAESIAIAALFITISKLAGSDLVNNTVDQAIKMLEDDECRKKAIENFNNINEFIVMLEGLEIAKKLDSATLEALMRNPENVFSIVEEVSNRINFEVVEKLPEIEDDGEEFAYRPSTSRRK